MTAPALPRPAAVLFGKDLVRLAAFYEAVAGLQIETRDPGYVVLSSAGFELVLHGMPAEIADAITVATPPELREDVPVKLCFPVARLGLARARAAALGGGLAPPEREWSWPERGVRVCDGHDPEGHVIQLREALP